MERDGFTGGFLSGVIIGGVMGAIAGRWLVERRTGDRDRLPDSPNGYVEGDLKGAGEGDRARMEAARQSLEDKIAQLNSAIDEVRQQFSRVAPPPTEPADSPAASGNEEN